MTYNTVCQFCGNSGEHKTDCPVLKMIDQNNTFVASVTEKLVAKEIAALKENAEEIKRLTTKQEEREKALKALWGVLDGVDTIGKAHEEMHYEFTQTLNNK